MNLYKTSFYTGISTAVTFVCGFIVAKVVAVKIGPAGIAMVGQFQNSTALLAMLGTGAISMGVVKYLSENKKNIQQQQVIITHAFSLIAVCSLAVSVFIVLASGWLSRITFHTQEFWIVYLLFGFSLALASLNTIFLSIYNGLKEIRKLVVVNIFTSIAGVSFTLLFANLFEVKGVLAAVNATALVTFLLNYFLFGKLSNFRFSIISFSSWDKALVQKLLTFSLMSSVSAFVLPSMQLIVRSKIIHDFSIKDAGYWQGVTRISDYYLAFVTTVLGVYYLPKLSELRTNAEVRTEIFRAYKVVLPVVAFLALLMWVFRYYVVVILFSNEFLPMQELFAFQLMGDVVKIASWLLGFVMWARAMARTYIVTEILFGLMYIGISFLFIDNFGLVGATYAFALNYLLYLLIMFYFFRHLFFGMSKSS